MSKPASRAAERQLADIRRRASDQLRQAREDAGVTVSALAREARLSVAQVCRIEANTVEPSLDALARSATALGATLDLRLDPGTGPRIRDRHQARIVEALLRVIDSRWRPFVEVPVWRPARGVVDIVLWDQGRRVLVTAEVESTIKRLEQLLRWTTAKAESLPSSHLWQYQLGDGPPPVIHRLLVLRSTAMTRQIADTFGATLAAAYPARARDLAEALSRPDVAWPGSGVLWASVEAGRARILQRPPRGVAFGR